LKKLNSIPGLGDFARVAFAGPLGVLEFAAHPSGFWHSIKYNTNGTDVFLFGPMVLTWAMPATASLSDSVALRLASTSLGKRFSGVLLSDLVLGTTQTAMNAGLSRGTHHWNWETFRQGMEYTVGGIAWARAVAGIGYSPYKMKVDTFVDFVNKNVGRLGEDDVLFFRERDMGIQASSHTFRPTSPWQEKLNLGYYHEGDPTSASPRWSTA
jgi:hypothetical protein